MPVYGVVTGSGPAGALGSLLGIINASFSGPDTGQSLPSDVSAWLSGTLAYTDDADFVEHMYWTLCGRASDPSGKAYWINELASNSRKAVVIAAFYCPECQAYYYNNVNRAWQVSV